MARTRRGPRKRLAAALRENLKRRKAQARESRPDSVIPTKAGTHERGAED